jgi:nicotinate-nucleotide adenylyltransferase
VKRIGVLGGTFDPLHLGHLRAAEVVRDALRLEKVLFVPAATPPHKTDAKSRPVTDAEHRAGMLSRALADEPFFELSRVELDRGGRSYTIDTLEALGESAGDRFFFVTGTDAFAEIRTWKSWEKLLSAHWFVVHERPGFPIEAVRDVLPEGIDARVLDGPSLEPGTEPRVSFLRGPMLKVSSTEIRRSVREGRSIRFLVPDIVADYIRENRLYR